LADTRARRAANPACTYTSAELPTNTDAHPQNPTAPPCPTTCTDFGWEIYPEGSRRVLGIAGGYGKPIYVTENGRADGDDDLRATYVPLNSDVTYATTKPAARAIAELLAAETHEAVVSRLAKALRSGKVLVDWSQNTEHKSMVLRLLSTGEAASDGLDADHLGRG
jgi:hypothetical protein